MFFGGNFLAVADVWLDRGDKSGLSGASRVSRSREVRAGGIHITLPDLLLVLWALHTVLYLSVSLLVYHKLGYVAVI